MIKITIVVPDLEKARTIAALLIDQAVEFHFASEGVAPKPKRKVEFSPNDMSLKAVLMCGTSRTGAGSTFSREALQQKCEELGLSRTTASAALSLAKTRELVAKLEGGLWTLTAKGHEVRRSLFPSNEEGFPQWE